MNPNLPSSPPLIGIVLPCYNEEEVLPLTFAKIEELLIELIDQKKISRSSFAAFVDDGSKDRTWELIENKSQNHSLIRGLKLSANRGHQAALLSGLHYYTDKADALISIDADLQDDVRIIPEMIDRYMDGYEQVYAARKRRDTDTFFKKQTAEGYYRLMERMGVSLVFNHADYRLSSKNVLQALKEYSEVNLFLRGIFPLIGYKSCVVYYDRLERAAGESKYPLRKMIAFAFEGITSFSTKPLRWITFLGIAVFFVCLFMVLYAVYAYFFKEAVPGWTSTVLPMYFLGGIQLLSIGILGEYLGKIYKEVKRRPIYTVEKESIKNTSVHD